jgi:cell fate (sporulation/competence/biofilm development) regulator YlbF (YheA/YmcA/DUF963 family)
METNTLPQQILEQLKAIQQANQTIQLELGQIELLKIELKQRRVNAQQYLSELREEEATLSKYLEETLGPGTIDLESGTFIPST